MPYIWHDNFPSTGDRRIWESAARLWQLVRPSLEEIRTSGTAPDHPLMRARGRGDVLKAAVEQPTEYSVMQLARTLAIIFDAYPSTASQVEAEISGGVLAPVLQAMASSSASEIMNIVGGLQRQIAAMRRSASSPDMANLPIASCQACGRQDETLRVVVYPFVVSAFVVTFRRAFAGLWCSRHAAMYQFLASAITLVAGWWGIPFGFVFTPMALLTLARGGNQPAENNQRMLMGLAQHKLKNESDPQGARRCLEAALDFGRSPALEARLREIYTLYPDTDARGGPPRLILFPLVLLAAGLIGIVVGLFEWLFVSLFDLLEDVPDLVGIMSWVPLVLTLFLAGMVVAALVEGAITRTKTRGRILGGALAVMASLIVMYFAMSGEILGFIIFGQYASRTFATVFSAVSWISWALTLGGSTLIEGHFSDGTLSSGIWMTIIIIMTVVCLVATTSAARRATTRLKEAADLRGAISGDHGPGSATGWLALFGSLIMTGILFVGAYVLSQFQYGSPATLALINQGMTSLGDGDVESARATLEEAKKGDPESFMPYYGLSIVDLQEGNCQQSMTDILAAKKLAPEQFQSIVDMYVGEAYACSHQTDKAISAYQTSVQGDPTSEYALAKLGLLYFFTGDRDNALLFLQKAREVNPYSAIPHAALAMIYFDTDQPGNEQAAIEQALAQKLDERSELEMIAYYYFAKNDFETAEKYLRQDVALAPRNPNSLLALGSVLVNEGKYDEVTSISDRILAGKTNPLPAYILRCTMWERQEQLDKAMAELDKAEAIRPGDSDIQNERAWVYFFSGDYDKAIAEAGKSLKTQKYNSGSLTVQALSYQAQGKLDEAFAAAQQAAALNPKYDLPHYVLGVYYMEKGEKPKARAELKKFLDYSWERAYANDLIAKAKKYMKDLGGS